MVPGAEPRVYDEVVDFNALQKVMDQYLDDYNVTSKAPMPLVLFWFAIEHISRISRVLKQPKGHLLLVGKTMVPYKYSDSYNRLL